MSQQTWNERYGTPDRVWSGRPNHWLVEFAQSLPPGTAADLGCGEGADAIWLAERGWQVTAVDFAATGLTRARHEAAAADVTIDWALADLTTWQPPTAVGLVSVQFFHADPVTREQVHRNAWAATAGTLLVVGHHPQHVGGPPDAVKYTAEDILDSLGLAADAPEVVLADTRERGAAWDSVVVLRRQG